jgi:hypothetical protein
MVLEKHTDFLSPSDNKNVTNAVLGCGDDN